MCEAILKPHLAAVTILGGKVATRNWCEWSCHGRGGLGTGGGGKELGDGKAGHARGAHPGQGGDQVQAEHTAGRRDHQRGAGKERANHGLRGKTPLSPQDGWPVPRSAAVLGSSTPGTSTEALTVGHPQARRRSPAPGGRIILLGPRTAGMPGSVSHATDPQGGAR